MPEPTAPAAVATLGAGALVLGTLGVEPQALLWSAVGASIGISLAPQTGRVRAVVTFGAVVLLSAVFGTWLAQEYLAGSSVARNAATAALAMLFHPLFAAAVTGLPQLVTSLTNRIVGGPRA